MQDGVIADKASEINFPISEIDPKKDLDLADQEQENRSILMIKYANKPKTFSFNDANYK